MKLSMWNEWLFDASNTARDDFWEGRAMTTCNVLGYSYVVITLGALLVFSLSPVKEVADLKGCWRLLAIAIGIIVSAGPPAFFWLEAKAFDWWVNQKILEIEQQRRLRETYKLNADNGKAFWGGILAVYAGVLLNW